MTANSLDSTSVESSLTLASCLEPGYLVICWNDPVNYMDYVTHVFQTVFGWPRKKAEHYVHQFQKYTLHATMERDE